MPASVPRSAPAAAPPAVPVRPVADKRAALLDAARRLIARAGLHDTPISALARAAGVGAGTVYRYFPSKDALINALYLELLDDQHRAATADAGALAAHTDDPRASLWRAWSGLARWHLDHPEASNVIHQCRASGILTTATRDRERRATADGLAAFAAAIARGVLRDLPRDVFWALYTGPIVALVAMRDAGELDVTDALLRATFDGVCRSVLPAPVARVTADGGQAS